MSSTVISEMRSRTKRCQLLSKMASRRNCQIFRGPFPGGKCGKINSIMAPWNGSARRTGKTRTGEAIHKSYSRRGAEMFHGKPPSASIGSCSDRPPHLSAAPSTTRNHVLRQILYQFRLFTNFSRRFFFHHESSPDSVTTASVTLITLYN